MAENILKFQKGREAAIAGRPRDARRSDDWLEGWDCVNFPLASVADQAHKMDIARNIE